MAMNLGGREAVTYLIITLLAKKPSQVCKLPGRLLNKLKTVTIRNQLPVINSCSCQNYYPIIILIEKDTSMLATNVIFDLLCS